MTVIVQPGPRNAYSDPETGLRMYRWRDRDLVSVTSARRMAGMPFALVSWQISRILTRVCGQVHDDGTITPGDLDTLTAMLTREKRPRERVVEKNRIKEARTWLRAAATEERDTAAALGTAVHDAAAAGWTVADVPDTVMVRKDSQDIEVAGEEIRPRLAQYLDWLHVAEVEVVLAERQVWSPSIGYAGSFDLITRDPDGTLSLIDIKTGSGLYSEHLLQLIAYLMADHIGEDDVVDEEATALLHQVGRVGILHLSEDGWEQVFPRMDLLAEAWGVFRSLLRFALWTAEHADSGSWIASRRKGSAQVLEAVA